MTNHSDKGLGINIAPFWGTDYTDSSVSLTAWRSWGTGFRTPNNTSTWWTTNDATFEVTGVQLEVGSVATDFKHRSFGREMELCQRYFQRYTHGTYRGVAFSGRKAGSGNVIGSTHGFPAMRAAATSSVASTAGYKLYRFLDGATAGATSVSVTHEGSAEPYNVLKYTLACSSFSTGNLIGMYTTSTAGSLSLDAEL